MICHDMVRRLTLFQKRADDGCDLFGLLRGEIDPLSGVFQRDFVFLLGVFGTILILVESTAVPIGTTVTGPRRTVSSGTAERNELRAILGASTTKDTFLIVGAFQRQSAPARQFPMESDFLSDRGLVLSNRLSDGRFGGAVCDSRQNDSTLLKRQMEKLVRCTHTDTGFPAAIGHKSSVTLISTSWEWNFLQD